MQRSIRGGQILASRLVQATTARPRRRTGIPLVGEVLEDRRLMAASLQPISGVTVPALQGYVVPLNGSATAAPQTFAVRSNNPDVDATVVKGPFWTLDVHYIDPSNSLNSFSGQLTFELFGNLTPNTTSRITQLTNAGGYNGTQIFRIVSNFSGVGGPGDTLLQGGPQPGSGTNPEELVQTLAYVQPGTLAIANAGPNTDGQEFFITTGPQTELNYAYTIFGQLVSGASTLAKIAQVPVEMNAFGENSMPDNPVTITSATVSASNPNGALVLDATQASPGESATITVTATDTVDRSSVTQSFLATVGNYSGPDDPPINFRPLAAPVSVNTAANTATPVVLAGLGGYPDPAKPPTLTFTLVSKPAHGSVSQFNASTGTFVYTPDPGFSGADSFRYDVSSTGPNAAPATLLSNPALVTITTAPPALPPPAVVSLMRTGIHFQPTRLVLTFNRPMNAATVQDLRNYLIYQVGPNGFAGNHLEPIPIVSAVYDPIHQTVTLTTRSRLKLSGYYLLTVSGLGAHPVVDVNGDPLTGTGTGGLPGDYIAVAHGYGPWHPATPAANVLKPMAVPAGPRSQAVLAARH